MNDKRQLISLRLRNIEARRIQDPSPEVTNIGVNNNSTITSVMLIEGRVSISFSFTCNYEPGIGQIKIDGELFLTDSQENMERIVSEWQKSASKNIPEDVAEKVHNTIIHGCMTESVMLARELHLPSPLPMPHVSLKKQEKKEAVAENKADIDKYIR